MKSKKYSGMTAVISKNTCDGMHEEFKNYLADKYHGLKIEVENNGCSALIDKNGDEIVTKDRYGNTVRREMNDL